MLQKGHFVSKKVFLVFFFGQIVEFYDIVFLLLSFFFPLFLKYEIDEKMQIQ